MAQSDLRGTRILEEIPSPRLPARSGDAGTRLELRLTCDLASLAQEWRQFEQHADCTAFQSYDWLDAWQRHIGARTGTLPALITGRCGDETVMILPLAVTPHWIGRRLTFLGRDLGDYNAPLLAFDFDKRYGDFKSLWDNILALLQQDERYRHDVVLLDKMPERVGPQPNPFLQLAVRPHSSGAYLAQLGGDWESFYLAKRSTDTQRRDRRKRKRLAQGGTITVTKPDTANARVGLMTLLIDQKTRAFARTGVTNIFARPGYTEFFRDIAGNPRMREFAYISSLDVGGVTAATNLGLCFRGIYYHVLASYDDGPLARFGPGAVHLQELMRHATEQGCGIFDFTVGDEPYKRDWCDEQLRLYDHVAAAGMRGVPTAAALAVLLLVKRSIKRSPTLWPAMMKFRATLRFLQTRRRA